MPQHLLAIDFGTTNSAVARFDPAMDSKVCAHILLNAVLLMCPAGKVLMSEAFAGDADVLARQTAVYCRSSSVGYVRYMDKTINLLDKLKKLLANSTDGLDKLENLLAN